LREEWPHVRSVLDERLAARLERRCTPWSMRH
jgi:hypothetical protein